MTLIGRVSYDDGMSLPNLNKLEADAEALRAERESVHFVCYDITSLRKINFAYGRRVGDELIRTVASWITMKLPGTLYRIEGDLFCVVLRKQRPSAVLEFAKKAYLRSQKPWELKLGDEECSVYATAAVCVIEADGAIWEQSLPDLFERTLDISRSTKAVAVYDGEADRLAREGIRFQVELKNCILHDMQDFDVYYQPIVDPISGIWRGLEALCRWQSRMFGPVPPGHFIPEAEKQGLMPLLGLWVMKTAIRTCVNLGLSEIDGFFLSINASASQLAQYDFADSVLEAVRQYDYPPSKLNLEITESMEFNFTEATRHTISVLQRHGITLALDDFGTGYSTFSNMKTLPAHYIKTEREFIADIEFDNYLQYSLYVISETAHLNGMRLIAEGVETVEQLRSAVKNGADLIQGYFFSRPLRAADLEANLAHFTVPDDRISAESYSPIDFSQWLSGQEAYQITPALFGLQSQCIKALLDEETIDEGIDRVLAIVGRHFSVGRAFVFLRERDAVFSNRYEWCDDGVESQKELFSRVDTESDGFYRILSEQDVIILPQEKQFPQNLRDRLGAAGVKHSLESIIVVPLKSRDEIIGFVGFDDARPREWLPEEMIILHNLCLLVLIRLRKREDGFISEHMIEGIREGTTL